MRIIAILVLVFGVALAGGALFFASEYFKELNASMAQQQGSETVRVLVAKQALGYGATLQSENLQWVEWPKAVVPPGAFTSVEELLGKRATRNVSFCVRSSRASRFSKARSPSSVNRRACR